MSLRYRTLLLSLSKYLPETKAIKDRAISEGFKLPSTPTLEYINTLIYSMKADGYWSKRDLILNFAYNDLNCGDFSRINWKNPSGALLTRSGFTNMIIASEVFDTGTWAKVTSPTVTDNVTIAPDGTMTGAKYNGGGTTSRIQRAGANILTNSITVPMTFSVYAKAEVLNDLRLSVLNGIGNFNLSTGVATVISGTETVGMENVGSGWYRCWINIESWAGDTVQIYTNPRFQGTDGIYIWGAQINEGGLLSYVKTTGTTDSGDIIYNHKGWRGFQGNNPNTFLNTNFSLTADSLQYTLTDAGRDMVVYENGFSNSYLDGNTVGFGESIRAGNFSTQRINANTNTVNSNVNMVGEGYRAINRTSANDVELFTNATQYSRTLSNSQGTSTGTQTIHKGAFLGGSSNMSYYSIGAEVVAEGQLFRTAYNNYLTNIGLSPIA